MNMDRELKKDCRNINSALSALGEILLLDPVPAGQPWTKHSLQ